MVVVRLNGVECDLGDSLWQDILVQNVVYVVEKARSFFLKAKNVIPQSVQ